MKTLLKITELTPSTITNADAVPLALAMRKAIDNGEIVVLSFHDVTTLTSSFLNSSIGEIIEEFGFDRLKGKLILMDYTPIIGKTVTKYIADLKQTLA